MPRTLVIEARKAKKLSQGALAKLMGVQPSLVSRLELGYADPSADEAQKIAKILGVQLRDIDTGLSRAPSKASALPLKSTDASRLSGQVPQSKAPITPLQPSRGLHKALVSVESTPPPAPVVANYDQAPDLSQPAKFNVTPDQSVLETDKVAADLAKARIVKAIKYAHTILHTSRVPAGIWSQWRSFEKAAEAKLRQL